MTSIDKRIIKINIDVGSETLTFDERYYISATGYKYANESQDEAEIVIGNIQKDIRNRILTETTPFNYWKNPKSVSISAGFEKTGIGLIYTGNITSSSISQPPDLMLKLRCLTGNFQKTNVVSKSLSAVTTTKDIASNIAKSLGVNLNFEAQNKNIINYNYVGDQLSEIGKLAQMGNIDTYLDNNTLVVKDIGLPLNNSLVNINADTGMIGTPELIEWGVKVTFFINQNARLGGRMRLRSKLNPAVDGDYAIYKLGFTISSRDTPFYQIAEGIRITPA